MKVVTKLGSDKGKNVKDRQTKKIESIALIPSDTNPANL